MENETDSAYSAQTGPTFRFAGLLHPISSHPQEVDSEEHHLYCTSHVSILPQLYPVLPAPFLRMLRAAHSKPNLASSCSCLAAMPSQEPLENVHVTKKK
jgi:hypothetical protein